MAYNHWPCKAMGTIEVHTDDHMNPFYLTEMRAILDNILIGCQ